MIDNASALKMLFLLKQIIQIKQYAVINAVSAIKYCTKASFDENPNPQLGIISAIKPKQQNLPICSKVSTTLLLHKLWKPSLFFIANTIFGIIITSIKASPYMFIQFILLPPQIQTCTASGIAGLFDIYIYPILMSLIQMLKRYFSFL